MPPTSALSLHMTRLLPAPRSHVFAALTEPGELARWWGPNGFAVPSLRLDLRLGGSYRIAMQPPDGELFYLVGEYLEVDPPAKVAYTFRWEDPDPEDRETVVTLALRDVDEGAATELTLTQGDFLTERRRALHDEGWTNSLDRLHELLSAAASAPGG